LGKFRQADAKIALSYLPATFLLQRLFCTVRFSTHWGTSELRAVPGYFRYGNPGAVQATMMTRKKPSAMTRTPMILGTVSWIADELIGIRTLEHRLSRRLESRAPQNNELLASRLQDLNQRIDLLDRALDEYISTGKVA
jgi:hypothetical protein